MHWLYIAMLTFIFFACFAMMIREGLWSNIITFYNFVLSGVLAFAYYGMLADWFDEMTDGEYTYVFDFIAIWTIFIICMIVLRLVTDMLSRLRVRFKKPVETVGGPAVALLAAWLMTGFVSATMHTAPLPDDFLGSAILVDEADDIKMGLFKPHLHWLRIVGTSIIDLAPGDTKDELLDEMEKDLNDIEKVKKGFDKRFGTGVSSYLASFDSLDGGLWARLFILRCQERRAQYKANSNEGSMRVKR